MTFSELKGFLESKMKMSHVYQPLLIKTLVDAGGSATIRQLATTFLSSDESQILYYEKRLKQMPIKVLSKHGIISKEGDLIRLSTVKMTLEQRAEIKKVCESKIQQYITTRGLSIWDYRLLDESAVPDSLRFRILKEAKGRCALCGVMKDERPLDVDHIIPRSRGGKTVYENLQALCSKCNRSKLNKDETDFRNMIEKDYDDRCPFCGYYIKKDFLLENDHAFVRLDNYPVTRGHSLVIPKRHLADYFGITKTEHDAIHDLIQIRRKQLLEGDSLIGGFNVGVNAGETAGQSVFHCHFHLIPRRKGDYEDPKGGVRGVIPDKMKY